MVLCLIRNIQVVKTPEEEVRQNLLQYLISLNYPKSLIVVEKALTDFSFHQEEGLQVPVRRMDILVVEKKTLNPLLLVECKSIPFTNKILSQVIGYNYFIRAPFIAIANADSIYFGKKKEGNWVFQEGLPSYEDLLSC